MITMGYGHLTIITMGLGNAFCPGTQERRVQFGAVEFQNVATGVSIADISPEVFITDEEKQHIDYVDKETEVHYG